VKGSIPAPRIGQFVASCGIDFEPTDDAIGRLRSAGALESVLAAVRAASGPNARKRKAESVLWESIKDSQDASVFEDYLRRYSEGQYATPARQKYRDLKVAGMREEMVRALAAGQWDAGDERIRDLLRVVSADDEITGWQQRVANGREAERKRAQRVSDLRVAIPSDLQAGQWASADQSISDLLSLVPADSQAMQWRSQVAEAMDRLGYAYEYGLGLAQSYPQALAWFRKAAENDNPAAMTHLGGMYWDGRGVVQDDGQAGAWFRRAAEKSETSAMNNLGVMYERGQGVTQDSIQAVTWYQKAALLGNEGAKANLKRLSGLAAPPKGSGSKKVNPKDGLTYVWIPPGTFQMGCSPADSECFGDEKPAHEVTITKGFWLGQTPVTQQAYHRMTRQNPSHFKGANLPVDSVNWDKASAYCAVIGGRLPTEAEWEYSARAGSTGARYGNLDDIAWYSGNSGRKANEVGQKQANALGLFDMLGNVWQWTADWYWYDDYQPEAQSDPSGPPGRALRVLRGGSWIGIPRFVRVSGRLGLRPGGRSYNFGFRCVGE